MAVLDADGLPPDISVETWAALQAIPVGRRVVGRRYGVRQPVCTGGTHGTIWVWTGLQFRPAGRQLVLSSNTLVTTAGPTTDEQLIRSTLFNVGVLAGVRIFSSAASFDRSAADTNNSTMRDRLGVVGGIADQTISAPASPPADRQVNFPSRFNILSATSIAGTPVDAGGGAGNTNGFDTRFGSSVARAAARTVTDLSANALYYSLTYQQGATPLATISSTYWMIWVE